MKKLTAFLLSMAMVLALAGCTSTTKQPDSPASTNNPPAQDGDAKAPDSGSSFKFATISDANNAWNDRLYQGAVKKCDELGNWEVSAFDPQGDVAKQIDLVSSCITQGFNAICLQPIDNAALAPVMKEAADAGIIMMSLYELDSSLGLDDSVYQVVYDQEGIFYHIVYAFADAYGLRDTKGIKVAVLGGRAGADNTNQRHAGIERALSELGWEEVAKIDCDWDQQLAMGAAEDILTAHPDVQVFLAMTDPMAFGAISAIEAANKKAASDGSGIYVIGGEFCEESKPFFKDGRLAYSITCPSPWFSQTAIDVANQALTTKDASHYTMLDYYWVTAENCDTAEY